MSTPDPVHAVIPFPLFLPSNHEEVNHAVLTVQAAATVVSTADAGVTIDRIGCGARPARYSGTAPEAASTEEQERVRADADAASMIARRMYIRQLRAARTLRDTSWGMIGIVPLTKPEHERLQTFVVDQWDRICILAQDLLDAKGTVPTTPRIPPRTPGDEHELPPDMPEF
ncbi:hypothetical protein GCM10029992_37690 [Glycomyces albus]